MDSKNKLTTGGITRRAFVTGALAAGLGLTQGCARIFNIVPRHTVASRGRFVPPSEQVRLAAIGIGNMGRINVMEIAQLPDVRLVALCDVDLKGAHTQEVQKNFPDLPRFSDFRELFDKMSDQFDAVMVVTPDHMHAPVSIAAMRRGKHVFCQKPLCHNIREARLMARVQREAGVATQMGNQGHASQDIRNIHDWVSMGAIGSVREVHLWTDRPLWPAGCGRPEGSQPVPAGMDWERWLGPAPMRPFHPAYHPGGWRGYRDFGSGSLGDIGCHEFDAPYWVLDLGIPTSVKAETVGTNNETFPAKETIIFEFPARGVKPPVTMTWFDGYDIVNDQKVMNQPPRSKFLEADRKITESGLLIIGSEGAILADMHNESARIVPEKRMREVFADWKKYDKKQPKSPGMMQEFIAACKGGPKAGSDFADYGAGLTELVQLGVVAAQCPGQELKYDSKKVKFTNFAEANKLIGRSYRKDWELQSIR